MAGSARRPDGPHQNNPSGPTRTAKSRGPSAGASKGGRRQEILDAARSCLIESGFAATRMDDVARRAGVSKGGLYFHFESKQALVEAVVARENARLRQALDALTAGFGTFREGLGATLRGLLMYAEAQRDAARLSLCVLDEASRSEALHELVLESDRAFLNVLEQLVVDAQERGEIAAERHPGHVAKLLLIAVEGAKAKFVPHDEWPWRLLVDELEVVLLGGLLVGPSDAKSPT